MEGTTALCLCPDHAVRPSLWQPFSFSGSAGQQALTEKHLRDLPLRDLHRTGQGELSHSVAPICPETLRHRCCHHRRLQIRHHLSHVNGAGCLHWLTRWLMDCSGLAAQQRQCCCCCRPVCVTLVTRASSTAEYWSAHLRAIFAPPAAMRSAQALHPHCSSACSSASAASQHAP